MFGFTRARRREPAVHAGPQGYRAYVIGDVHGRLDLLDELLAKIHAELQHNPLTRTLLVFVGDLIDRGPNSAQVVERLRTYERGDLETVFLFGNHEEVFLRVLAGETTLASDWLRFGGLQCLQSYGIDATRLRESSPEQVVELARAFVPASHVSFVEGFFDTWHFGDYLFVHAGIRPGVKLERQLRADLRWIREPFLSDNRDHGLMVVHGHTISEEIDERSNRIGIDTGAYRTGVLTALVIEGNQRWLIDTRSR